jgi:hypothetical protein
MGEVETPTEGTRTSAESPAPSVEAPGSMETPSVSESPTVGVSPAEAIGPGRVQSLPSSLEARGSVGTPSDDATPTVGVSSAGAIGPGEVETPTGGDLPVNTPAGRVDRPTDGIPPTVGQCDVLQGRESTTVGESAGPVALHGTSELPHHQPGKGRGWWATTSGVCFEAKRVQRVAAARHSLSLGEERVYETLWNAAEKDGVAPETSNSKVFSLGYDRIARLVRLNEKSVRLLIPKLIAKQALEVIAAENSAGQVGRTYRIFSEEELLRRQQAANLTVVVKNGRAVEFVWPVHSTVGEPPTFRSRYS